MKNFRTQIKFKRKQSKTKIQHTRRPTDGDAIRWRHIGVKWLDLAIAILYDFIFILVIQSQRLSRILNLLEQGPSVLQKYKHLRWTFCELLYVLGYIDCISFRSGATE